MNHVHELAALWCWARSCQEVVRYWLRAEVELEVQDRSLEARRPAIREFAAEHGCTGTARLAVRAVVVVVLFVLVVLAGLAAPRASQ